ncbi:hypothetical protein DL96DRAFT_1620061 [Flagelloscypha sp. PMI_526]|nr:hypothetical protein DL96DRAFT_1620061 [Flagelloscypha sp. PMI_526]
MMGMDDLGSTEHHWQPPPIRSEHYIPQHILTSHGHLPSYAPHQHPSASSFFPNSSSSHPIPPPNVSHHSLPLPLHQPQPMSLYIPSAKRPSMPVLDPDFEMEPTKKKSRTSPSSSHKSQPKASSSSSSRAPNTLLTPSQKKANHIQSEQKRRANIRRGYEALCTVVPSLREAIANEEAMDEEEEGVKGRRKKADKDSRAGPRSEGIVLGKSMSFLFFPTDPPFLTRLSY